MKVDKKLILNKIMYLNKDYIDTQSRLSMIESIVLLGLYYGAKGKKKIEVEPQYSIIVTAVSIVVQIKEKISNNIDNNINLIGKTITKETSGNVVVWRLNDQRNVITLIRQDNDASKDIILYTKITDEILCNIAYAILELYNNLGIESIENRNIFALKLREVLKYAG